MSDVIISTPNHSFAFLETDQGILREMSDRYTFRPDGYMFTPAYKAGVWNGEIRLIDTRSGKVPKGLVPEVIDSLESSGYSVSLKKGDFESFKEELNMVDVSKLGLEFVPYDYQINAVERILKKKRQVIISPTGSGKSLIISLAMRSLLEYNKSVLIVVPNVSLIHQLYSDIDDYFKNDDSWVTEEVVQKIAEGREKVVTKSVVIATWQSIYNIRDRKWFEHFDSVFVDECHLAKAKSITSVVEKCINATVKVGLTGTLDGTLVNEMVLRGLFGPVHQVAKTSDLIDAGILTNLKIKTLILKHQGKFPKLDYKTEIDYIVKHERRNKFIAKLAQQTKGNTLILFQFVEKHGKPLKELIETLVPEKQVHFVYGGVPGDEREQIRKLVESQSDAIILASYQTYSTGVNVKNLHNIIFASPSKGRVRIFQSIGRGLRLHETKDECTLYDIADDLRGTRKAPNHTLKHMMIRLESYYSEGFDVKCIDIDM